MKILVLILLLASIAWGQTPWRLTDASLNTQVVDVHSIDSLEVIYVDADAHPHHFPTNQLVAIMIKMWLRQSLRADFLLLLASGEKWAGQAVEMNNKLLIWQNTLLGKASFPLGEIKGIVRQGIPATASTNSNDDVIHLNNGDVVHGAISSMDDQHVMVQTSSSSKIGWNNIAAIEFASVGTPALNTNPPPNWRLAVDDGSVIGATGIQWSRLKVALRSDGHDYSLDTTHLISIQRRNGPVVFLASLPPAENKQVPLLGSPWLARFGEDLSGNPLPNAISVHAYSHLAWDVPGDFKTFHGQFSIPAELSLADVSVRIAMDGKTVFEQSNLHGGVTSPAINLPLNHAHHLVLEVDSINPYYTQDWLTWLSPALLR